MAHSKSGRNVSYVKPTEAPFIKRMKEQVGFKEGPTIDTKREQLPRADDDDDEDHGAGDDEKPQVVVVEPGDLTQEEAESILDSLQSAEVDAPEEASDQKISFKKPDKRENKESNELTVSTSKRRRKDSKGESEMKQVKNKSLLSFDDEENDDDN